MTSRIDEIVVDVQSANTIEQVGGWNHTELMGVSCAVVYEFQTDRFRVYGPGDVEALRARLLLADRITGFNTSRFDFPVIWGMPSRERVTDLKPKSNDLLQRIWRALGLDEESFFGLHKGWGLDAVCRGTLNCAKSGNGAEAPVWFQAGNWARLVDYCIDDVRLERDLGLFIDRYGYVVNGDSGQVLRIKAEGIPT